MRNWILLFVICALAPLVFANGASHWNHTTEAEFKKGKFNNTVATNLGDVKLSRAVKTLLEQDAKITAVYCLAEERQQAADGEALEPDLMFGADHGLVVNQLHGDVRADHVPDHGRPVPLLVPYDATTCPGRGPVKVPGGWGVKETCDKTRRASPSSTGPATSAACGR